MSADRRDRLDRDARAVAASRLLDSLQVRVGTLLPSAIAVLYAVSVGRVVRSSLLAASAFAVLALALVSALKLYPGDPATDPRARRFAEIWQLVSAVGGTALAVPFFLSVELPVEAVAGVFGLTLVIGAYVFPRGRRAPLLLWITLVWLIVLITNGHSQPVVLVVHAAGAGLLMGLGCLQQERLAHGLAAAGDQRRAAERRASLLGSVLRTNTLDPDQVLEETAQGLLDAGFEYATIRLLDHEAQVGRLVAQASVFEVDFPEVIEFSAGEFGRVVASRRSRLIRWVHRDPAHLGHNPLRDLYVLPLMLDDEVAATISVATAHVAIDDVRMEAAELLAEQASAAFFRARAYEADERIVGELRRLETSTREYVTAVSHELRTPLTVVSGVGDTLARRWDDLEPTERRELIARARRGTERLTEAVQALSRPRTADPGHLVLATEMVALRRTVVDRIRRQAISPDDGLVRVDVPESVQVDVDRVLFHYLLDESLAHVVGDSDDGVSPSVTAAPEVPRVEVVARSLGERVMVTVSRGTRPPDRSLGEAHRGLARASRLTAGLSLADEIVRAHGGRLTVTDHTVSFDVPA